MKLMCPTGADGTLTDLCAAQVGKQCPLLRDDRNPQTVLLSWIDGQGLTSMRRGQAEAVCQHRVSSDRPRAASRSLPSHSKAKGRYSACSA